MKQIFQGDKDKKTSFRGTKIKNIFQGYKDKKKHLSGGQR